MGIATKVVIAGGVSGAAYLAAQAADLAITRNRVDDRILLGRLTPVPGDKAKAVGTALHLINSVLFAAVFRSIGGRLLPGPMWFRGIVFANVENAALYVVILFEDYHPAIRDGQLDSYQTWEAFLQSVWRHIVLGAVLGLVLGRDQARQPA